MTDPMPRAEEPMKEEEIVNLTETPDATIRRLAGECIALKGHLDSLANFLRECGEADPINLPAGRAIGLIKNLRARVAALEGALTRADAVWQFVFSRPECPGCGGTRTDRWTNPKAHYENCDFWPIIATVQRDKIDTALSSGAGEGCK